MRLEPEQQRRAVEVARERGYRCPDCGSDRLVVKDEGEVVQSFGGEKGATVEVLLGCGASHDCMTRQALELTDEEARRLLGFYPPMQDDPETL